MSAESIPTDTRLLERVREGDARAFELLFHRYYDTLCRSIAHYLGDRDLVEDVVQSTLANLWNRRAVIDLPDSLPAYLHTAVRRRAVDEVRREAVRRRAGALLRLESAAARHETATDFDAEVLRRRLDRALDALSPRTREAFILSRGEGLSYNQIALRMGISVKTVGVHIANSLAAIRKVVPALLAILSAPVWRL